MPKMVPELSSIEVNRLKHPGSGRNAMLAVGGVSGLYMQITPTGARSWILRTTIGTKRRDVGLGAYPDVGLAQARERAREAKDKVWRGIDPIEERKAARAALTASQKRGLTFGDAFRKYADAKLAELGSDANRTRWKSSIERFVLPHIGDMLVDDLAVQDMLRVLEPIWHDKTETASRVRSRIEAILSWSTVGGHRTGDNLIAQANSAAAALNAAGVFVGSDGLVQTGARGRDASTDWRFEDPGKDYDTLGERRAREAAAKAAAAARGAHAAGAGGGGRKRGGAGRTPKAKTPFFADAERELQSLERQFELIGKTTEEVATMRATWELLDEAKRRGVPVKEKLMGQIDAQAAQIGRLTAELERTEASQQQFEQDVDGIADAFAGALVAGESLREGLAQVFKQIASDILSSGIRSAIMGQFGGGGFNPLAFLGGGDPLTARLALENEGSGIFSDNERACVVADTLEVAYSLMAITSDGVEEMQWEGRYGTWRQRENESATTAARS